jgi:hypothetical protein
MFSDANSESSLCSEFPEINTVSAATNSSPEVNSKGEISQSGTIFGDFFILLIELSSN